MSQEGTAARPIEELSLLELFQKQEEIIASAAHLKSAAAAVMAAIDARLTESAMRAFEQADKDNGTLTLELQDGLKAKADIKKTVTWDSDVLQSVAQTMPWDRVKAMFGIKFSVSETIYKGIGAVDPALKAKIDEARTVKLSPPKITLVRE